MPTRSPDYKHRQKSDRSLVFLNACVARPVSKKEIEGIKDAIAAQNKEWGRLIDRVVWSYDVIREWDDLAKEARRNNQTIHLGRIFGIMVENGSELPKGDERRKYKYRAVFQGNQVVDQHWEAALFQDLGSSPASMDASRVGACLFIIFP